ncbi:Mur ligase family protein [Crocinitomicaceae bacterium]|nr:Mur ligase family protein [Crocinitomicaceae bacterium]
MKVHFIAIGGSAMHNLAIALSRKGMNVTGSDDEIFEPSKSRLKREGILPEVIGWSQDRITTELDAVILGMHARADNPELLRAKELDIPVYSYPEYLYEQSKNKKRIVIGGSHGKTTITSMLLHVVDKLKMDVDYMVGAQLDGYDCMVRITEESNVMILEGDEYLSSPIDRRPKFHLYKPDVAIISGIAWDHINVFPTFKNYVEQFDQFCNEIVDGGTFIYNLEDPEVRNLGEKYSGKLHTVPYSAPKYEVTNAGTLLYHNGKEYELNIFGAHNLQNLIGAMHLGERIGIDNHTFLKVSGSFTGAGKRLQKVVENESFVMYKDFAHSPSKLKATTRAVKDQYKDRTIIACMELHTFSSLKKEFLEQYHGAMEAADVAVVYYSPEVVAHKKLDPISKETVLNGFGGNVLVMNRTEEVLSFIRAQEWDISVLLMMSSGNFDGIAYDELGTEITDRF